MKYILDIASKKELDLWENIKLGYTESEGHPLLREAVLQYYKLNSIENVVVASPGELNFITMNVLLSPEDHVICISPSYQSLYEVVRSVRLRTFFLEAKSQKLGIRHPGIGSINSKKYQTYHYQFPAQSDGKLFDSGGVG